MTPTWVHLQVHAYRAVDRTADEGSLAGRVDVGRLEHLVNAVALRLRLRVDDELVRHRRHRLRVRADAEDIQQRIQRAPLRDLLAAFERGLKRLLPHAGRDDEDGVESMSASARPSS